MGIGSVLLIDDEEDIRLVATLCLRRVGGWQVTTAGSGAEGLAAAVRTPPDLILLDVMMPEHDGALTLADLRANPATAAIPVVFLTAKVQRAESERYRALGAAGVIAKPFDPLTLVRQIEAIVSPSRRSFLP